MSSALVGSSSTMKVGSSTTARATAMRWRWPPENSCGKRKRSLGIEADIVERLDHALVALASVSRGWWTHSPSLMMSATDMRGDSEP